MVVHWEVEDGYVGKSGPQETEIPDYELEDCESEEEKQSVIEEYVQNDFESKISYSITTIEE